MRRKQRMQRVCLKPLTLILVSAITFLVIFLMLFSLACKSRTLKPEEETPYKGSAILIVKTIGETRSYKILFNNVTALQMLSQNFNVTTSTYPGIGAFIKCISNVCGEGNFFWAFYINNKSANVGASTYKVMNGDIIEFRFTDKLE